MLGYSMNDTEDAVLQDTWTNDLMDCTLSVQPQHVAAAVQCICVKSTGSTAEALDLAPYDTSALVWDLWRFLKDRQLRGASNRATRAEPIQLLLLNLHGNLWLKVLLTVLRLLAENDLECTHRAYPTVTLLVASPNECDMLHLLLRTVGPKRGKQVAVHFDAIRRFFDLLKGCGNLTTDA